MGLFGKKKTEPETCGCGGTACGCDTAAAPQGVPTGVVVLGSGCCNCEKLEDAVRTALTEMGSAEEVSHIYDIAQIAALGVMSTPALMVDGRVVSAGRVLTAEQARDVIVKARGE